MTKRTTCFTGGTKSKRMCKHKVCVPTYVGGIRRLKCLECGVVV